MPTGSPTTIGPFRIERELGRGGMGVVYLAHDTRLNRRVAIKALPEAVAGEADRLARFEREARVLASLNHPNLAAVYDVLEQNGRGYLAMEYVEGESLADRIRREGALPIAETIDIARQIAAGMEAAHEGGVVHRDLKPENVMLTPGDAVKIVDFGLAKGRVDSDDPPVRGHAVSPVLSSSPTMETPGTMPGVILGTAPYLSPEQARGKVVDRRTDIWSFGCVLYECLTGKKLFAGETVSDTVAAILERPIDLSALPPATPQRVRDLLTRCLERDPRRRLRDIGEARLMLEEAARPAGAPVPDSTAGATPVPARPAPSLARRVMPWVGVLGALILGWRLFGDTIRTWVRGPAPLVLRLSVPLPRDFEVSSWTMTGDGSTILLSGRPNVRPNEAPQPYRMYRRRLDHTDLEPIAGTEGVTGFGLSPDSRMAYGFIPQGTGLQLVRMPVDGSSPPEPILHWKEGWIPGTVLASGSVMFTVMPDRWAIVDPNGHVSDPVSLGVPGASFAYMYEALPSDRGVLFQTSGADGQSSIGVLDLKSRKSSILLSNADSPSYDHAGHLIFARQGTLMVVPFDVGRLQVRGQPAALMGGLYRNESGISSMTYAHNGTFAYRPGSDLVYQRALVIIDPAGKRLDWSPVRKGFEPWPAVSPDGMRVAETTLGSEGAREGWIFERDRASAERVPIPEPGDVYGMTWSPDGSRIAYGLVTAGKGNSIYVMDVASGGSPVEVSRVPAAQAVVPSAWTPDGAGIVVSIGTYGSVRVGLVAVPASRAGAGQASPVPASGAGAGQASPGPPSLLGVGTFVLGPAISPDGKTLAYQSMESGDWDVFVRPYTGSSLLAGAVRVTSGGGIRPRWSRDGRWLYSELNGKIVRSEVTTQPTLRASPPQPVWDMSQLQIVSDSWDILPDGRLLAVQKNPGEEEFTRIDLALHFDQEIARRVKQAR